MSRLRFSLILSALLCTVLAPFGAAQVGAPFTISVQQEQDRITLADGGTLTMAASAVGAATTASVTITYTGSTSATVNTVQLTGSVDFTASGFPDAPFTISRGESVSGSIRFQPATSNRVSGRLAFNYTEGRTTAAFGFNLTGVAPEFVVSFTPQGGNATLVSPGGTIAAPLTAIDATSNTTIVVTNRGSGAGVVKAISLAGAQFEPIGLPLPDTSVEAGRDVRFTIGFTPKQLDQVRGSLTIQLADRQLSFTVQGSGSGPRFTYQTLGDSGAVGIAPNQLVTVPNATVGEKSSLVVRVGNTGNADGRITAISVAGTGFQLADVPFLPLTLAVGNSFTFTINFNPTEAGRASGRLKVGDDTFDITATGLGSLLAYSYVVGEATTTVQNNGSVILAPASVGGTSTASFRINNTGTAPASVNSIGLTAASTLFTLLNVPALPATVAAGGSLSFTVEFAPATVGNVTATLKVDTQTFTLSGTGTPPAPLPGYRFEGPIGAQAPRSQPAIGLTLSRPYALPLTGTLTLVFNSDVFSNDPAVQFATGGRTVSFTIPANSTQAVFPSSATQIRIQTGTVAGTITVTPSFATEGGINLTPTTPPAATLSVAQAAPSIIGAVVSARTANSLTLLITGYSTPRSITQMELQFTPVTGESVATTKLTIPVEAPFTAWFQSSQSQPFGSLFTATVPLSFQGDVRSVSGATDTVQSIAITLSNAQGASAAQSVSLR